MKRRLAIGKSQNAHIKSPPPGNNICPGKVSSRRGQDLGLFGRRWTRCGGGKWREEGSGQRVRPINIPPLAEALMPKA